jgi:pilus assembly protein Flp/PilA
MTCKENIMNTMIKSETVFERREGVTAIEYGLIAALIAVVIVGAVQLVGTSLIPYSRLSILNLASGVGTFP